MPIRDDAIAAYNAEQTARTDDARTHLLSGVLANPADGKPVIDPKTLTTVEADHGDRLYVFTDGDVHLAVQGVDDPAVYLVVDDGGWAKRSGPLVTLADLGAVLAAQGG